MNYLPLLLLLLSSYLSAQPTAEKILKKAEASINIYNSVIYDAEYYMKFFNGDDTLHEASKVYLENYFKDSISIPYKVKFANKDSTIQFYDQDKVYFIDPTDKKAISSERTRDDKNPFRGNIRSDLIWSVFLKPSNITSWIKNENEVKLLNDTVINNMPVYQVYIKFPDEPPFLNNFIHYFITKEDHIPIAYRSEIEFQGNIQYKFFAIKNYEFQPIDPIHFSVDQIPPDYNLEHNKPRTEEELKLLEIETIPPVIEGSNYFNGNTITSSDLKDKIIVLDFWYMACYPCILAIPELEAIHQKYKDKDVVVLGINSVDNSEAGKKKFPKFLENNTISYDIILVDKKLPEEFLVRAWPSLYIIGKDGKVKFTQIGFNETLSTILEEEIEKLLSE